VSTVTVTGVKEVQAKLRKMQVAVVGDLLKDILTEAAEPIAETARALVPVRTGQLKSSLGVFPVEEKRYLAEVTVRPDWPKGAHGHLNEFGTVKMSPQPFMGPAFESNKDRVKADIERRIKDAVFRAV